ncbi:hypothetical protein YC2023_083244 [Brassica napus]
MTNPKDRLYTTRIYHEKVCLVDHMLAQKNYRANLLWQRTHDKAMHKEMQRSSNGFLPIEILPCNAFSPLIHLMSLQL